MWMCALICVNQLGFGGIVPAMPLYAESFGVSATAIGFAVAAYGLARFLIGMPTGKLSDWLGRRPTLAIGGIVSAIGNLWCAEADTYTSFMVGRFIAGLGAGLVLTAGQVVLADISMPAWRARMMAIYQGVFLFSVGLGPLPGGWLADQYGLAAPFYAYTVAAVIVGIIAYLAVPETRGFKHAGDARPAPPPLSFGQQIRMMAGRLGFVLAGLVSFMNAFTRTGALFALVPLFGATQLGLSITEVGFCLALASVAGLVITYPAGWVADRHGRKFVIVPMTVLMGASYVMYSVAPSFAWFLVATLIWGLTAAASGSAPAAYAADSAPPGMNAAAMSLFRTLGDFGYVVGPVALGFMADYAGLDSAFLLCAVLLALTGVAFGVLAPETHRAQQP